MKFLTDRHEIAMAINVERIPVLTMDIRHHYRDYKDCYSGSEVAVMARGLPQFCNVSMWGDEPGNECHDTPWMYGKVILGGGGIALKASFGLQDVDEMVKWSNARVVNPGDKVLVYFRGNGCGFLRMMRIPERVNPHCTTLCVLEDI